MVSSEMEELIHVADRVRVMHEGELAGELPRAEVCEERILRLATGVEGRRSGAA
jgi:ABC-type sugar transport system ATPase subunit